MPSQALTSTVLARPGFRKDINGLRGVAVTLVVLYHFGVPYFSAGFIGVDIFFVISGFLMASLGEAHFRPGRFDIWRFFTARLARIVPALAALLLCLLAVGYIWLLPPKYVALGQEALTTGLFVANFNYVRELGYFESGADKNWLLHCWSLAVEMQFYLVVPLFYFVANRTKGGIMTVIAMLALLSFALNVWLSLQAPKYAFFMMPPRIWEFLAGSALFYLRPPKAARTRMLLASLGLAVMLLAAILIPPHIIYPGAWVLLPVIAACLVIWARSSLSVLESWPLQKLGLISYSVYLWHWPLLLATRLCLLPPTLQVIAALMVATLVLSWLTYVFIEVPFRGKKAWLTRSTRRQASISFALIVIASLPALLISELHGIPGRIDPQTSHIVGDAIYKGEFRDRTCFLGPDQDAQAFTPECDLASAQSPRKRVIIWGDSWAAQLYTGLAAQPWAAHYDIGQLTASLCPPFLHRAIDVRPNCEAIQASVLERIGRARPETVILSANWSGYAAVATDRDKPSAPQYLKQQMTQTVAALHARGVREVVIVGPVPIWGYELPDLFFTFRRQNEIEPVSLPNINIAMARRQDAALAVVPGAIYLNLTDRLCAETTCKALVPSITGWKLTQFDQNHLTPAGSFWVARNLIGPALNESIVVDSVLPGQTLVFSAGAAGVRYLGDGWMPPEGWGVWSSMRPATLFLPVSGDWTPSKLKLQFWGQLGNPPHTSERFRFEVKGDGPIILEATSAQPIVNVEISIGPGARAQAQADGALVIQVEAPEAKSPAEMGLNTDQRKLGFGLRGVTIE